MENFESQQHRDELAEEIKGTPKEERKDFLDEAKNRPEYWQARTEIIKDRQDEKEIDEGLGILVKKKTLYHGSGTSGIEAFNKAEEDTVGSGIYFTSEAKDAIGYARRRSHGREGALPVIYESSVENMKLLNLRKTKNVKKILDGFKEVVKQKLNEQDLTWSYEAALQGVMEAINSGKVGSGNLREVTFSTGEMFSNYVKSIGYEGLITFEGGEGDSVGDHDTFLVFDPERTKINQEHQII